MTITEFLLARIAEDEDAAREAVPEQHTVYGAQGFFEPTRVLKECAAKRAIIKQHEAWPVLVEQPLEFTDRADDGSNVIFQASRKIAWLTEREYVKRFGEEPPTAPMIRTLASVYSDHPGYNPDWAL